jgi:glutamate/tyrosine decarboxylase-like PLP-dependent enzyme
VNILGLGRGALRIVPTGADGRLVPDAVEEAILAAHRERMNPFCLVGVAGTTVTGTIEPIAEMAAIARRHGMWFHVDAAYGGSLVLSERLRGRMRGCESADSITWNPQKWLYVPKTCASILFRDGRILDDTIRERFVYGLANGNGAADESHQNLGEFTIQGTRRVDVLKLWLTLEHFGIRYLQELIEENIERARWLAGRIRETPGLELVSEPDLGIVCFRAIPEGVDPARDAERLDAVQSAVQKEVARRGHGWLSLPVYRGRRVLRAVILHPRADRAVLERLLDDVRDAARMHGQH